MQTDQESNFKGSKVYRSWNKEVWGEKRTYLEVLMDSTLTKDIIQYIINLHWSRRITCTHLYN